MAIAINGSSNTITGIAVGGLPDGIVDTDMLAADSVTAPKIGSKTFTSYAIIADQKTQNSSGGTFTSGSFRHRDLNTILYDPDSIVSLSSNDFTLQAGSYFVRASAPAFGVDRHMALLRNHTDGTNIQTGTAAYNASQAYAQTRAFVSARFTLGAAKALRITHKCEATRSGNGFGVESNFSTETYTIVEIFKEA